MNDLSGMIGILNADRHSKAAQLGSVLKAEAIAATDRYFPKGEFLSFLNDCYKNY
jgi:hypothetical protein